MREEKRYTQQQLSALLNIKQNTYSQYENGQRQIPIAILIRLSEIYSTSVDYLLNLTDYDEVYPRG